MRKPRLRTWIGPAGLSVMLAVFLSLAAAPFGRHLRSPSAPERANYRTGGRGTHPSPTGGTCALPGRGGGLKPVGRYPHGASPYGALDMAGNAWEWVADFYNGDHTKRIIRGGAFGYGENSLR